MRSIGRIVHCVQALVGRWADAVGEETRVVLRQRKFTPSTLAATFILGYLRNPRSSDEELAQMAAAVGVLVSTQAVEQRYTERLVDFLKALFHQAVQTSFPSDQTLVPLLGRFTDVQILDSTTICLPDALAGEFPGCGGCAGPAALKLQLRLSLKTGWLDQVATEPGRDCDLKTPLQHDLPPAGTLRITDLGYFDTGVFGRLAKQGAYWLSPLMVGTNVYDRAGQPLSLLPWLQQQGAVVDQPILLGAAHRVPCRLIAWRVPAEVANRRRQKIRKHARRKGRTPSAERLARCDWAILVTNVPDDRLAIDEVRVLYRARWQIELLFKRWKSQGQVVEDSSCSVTRQMVKLWSRLLAAMVQQWLQSGIWGRSQVSLTKAWDLIQCFALPIALALTRNTPRIHLRWVLEQLFRITTSTIRQNKRKKASTFEMLRDCSLLPYALT